jgi:DNA-binding MarR family transcriptional regulator
MSDNQQTFIEKRLEESLILRLIAVGERLKRRRDIISQNLGVSTQQWLILLHLAHDPNIPYFDKAKHKKPMMASEIADSLDVSRPNVTNMVNILLEKGLIDQVEDEVDRRRKRLVLSEKGQELVNSLQPSRKALNQKLFDGFSAGQKEQLLEMLELFMAHLETELKDEPYDAL